MIRHDELKEAVLALVDYEDWERTFELDPQSPDWEGSQDQMRKRILDLLNVDDGEERGVFLVEIDAVDWDVPTVGIVRDRALAEKIQAELEERVWDAGLGLKVDVSWGEAIEVTSPDELWNMSELSQGPADSTAEAVRRVRARGVSDEAILEEATWLAAELVRREVESEPRNADEAQRVVEWRSDLIRQALDLSAARQEAES